MTTTLDQTTNTILSPESTTILLSFASYLQDNSKAQNTIDTYISHVTEYINYTKSNILTRSLVQSYKNYILTTKQNSSETHNAKLSALKCYNEFLVEKYPTLQDSLCIIKNDFIKIQKTLLSPYTLDDKQILKFLDKIKSKESYRNYAIIYTLAYTGLRISECLNLKLKDIKYKDKELSGIGKGNKYREVQLDNDVLNVIKDYITNHRPNIESEYIFISRKSNNNYKISEPTINQIFNDYSDTITPHTLRHFRANDLVKNSGMTLGECGEQLGHSDIKTLISYTYSNKNEIREKLNKMKKVKR